MDDICVDCIYNDDGDCLLEARVVDGECNFTGVFSSNNEDFYDDDFLCI